MNNEQNRIDEWRHTRRIMAIGFAAFLALVGVAVAVGIFFSVLYPTSPVTAPYPFWRFGFGFGFIFPIFGLFFLFFVLRWIFWPWRPYGYRYYRRWGAWGSDDDAVSILRARYARGELSKEQYEQMMQDLRAQN